MTELTASELAAELKISRGRVSQYVAAGQLDGCFRGDGRGRRFDLEACAKKLGKTLDKGQLLGNGAQTRRVVAAISAGSPTEIEDSREIDTPRGLGATALPQGDTDRYELARTLKAEEEARRMRRQNAQEEGLYVLASEVQREVARRIGQEIAEFESVLREGARKVADRMGVDFRQSRQILMETWRDHRSDRSRMLAEEAAAATMTDRERAEDI